MRAFQQNTSLFEMTHIRDDEQQNHNSVSDIFSRKDLKELDVMVSRNLKLVDWICAPDTAPVGLLPRVISSVVENTCEFGTDVIYRLWNASGSFFGHHEERSRKRCMPYSPV
jgi:hypothetical protein